MTFKTTGTKNII